MIAEAQTGSRKFVAGEEMRGEEEEEGQRGRKWGMKEGLPEVAEREGNGGWGI